MEMYDLFYKWVPPYVRLPVLFILFFVILCANGVFLGNIGDMANSLGVYPEPFTAANNAMYIGMGLGLMTEARLKVRFSSKHLLLTGLSVMLLMNIVCATTSNPYVTVLAVLILGFAKISALIEVFVIWLLVWSKQLDTSRMYPFVYFVALGGLHLTNWTTTTFAYYLDWRYAYDIVFALLFACLLFTVVFVENHPVKQKKPLTGFDWQSVLLLAISMTLLDYVVVYGKVDDWFHSDSITFAGISSLIVFLFFVRRSVSIPSPLFNPGLLQKRNYALGLLLFFTMGIFTPGTFQSVFSSGILGYDFQTGMVLNLLLIPGIAIGVILCFIWYVRKYSPELLITVGFTGFLCYHMMMYNSFFDQFTLFNFFVPSIVKGFATAILYVSIGLYATRGFDLSVIMTASGVLILVRSFLGGAIFSGVYNYILYAGQIKHLDRLAVHIDKDNFFSTQPGGSALYRQAVGQAALTASKEITGNIIIIGLAVVGMLFLFYLRTKFHGSVTLERK